MLGRADSSVRNKAGAQATRLPHGFNGSTPHVRSEPAGRRAGRESSDVRSATGDPPIN